MKYLLILFFAFLSFTVNAQSFFSSVSGSCTFDSPVELGTRFSTSANATITALRFYKCAGANQTYSLRLYSGNTLMLSVPYTGTATGWINVTIPATSIIPGVVYTVSYYSPTGTYQAINSYAWPRTNGTLTATGSAYRYGGGYPNATFQTSNYFADLVVQGSTPPPGGRDTIYIRDTVTLPCYPPDSSKVVTNGNTVEKYYWYFDTLYRDTGRIIYENVFVYDTVYIQQPPVYIRDTIYQVRYDTIYFPIADSSLCPDSVMYLHDTLYLYHKDTLHVLVTWDGLDTVNYNLPHYSQYKVREITSFDGKKFRYVHSIVEAIHEEEWDEVTQTWIKKK
jgi:hypothetical protein